MRALLILISLLLIGCSAEEPKQEITQEELEAGLIKIWGDERTDFACTSYKTEKVFFVEEDNTSYQLTYSYNLGKRSVWVDDVLIDTRAYYNFDDDAIFTHDEETVTSYTFHKPTYQLEVSFLMRGEYEEGSLTDIRYHCLPI